jgi:predicted small metal-binding protein
LHGKQRFSNRRCFSRKGGVIGCGPASFGLSSSALPPYDDSVKQIPCVCGYVVKGEDDDELWKNAQEHLREDHPDLTGKVSREDLLAQAEEVSRPTS